VTFSEEEVQRYSRHILLAEVGGTGQAALRAARVLVVGAGGLGCPVLLYLAAAGVGTLGVVDDDVVELSNLQRQIAHGVADLGAGKVASAIAAARAINPLVRFVPHVMRVDEANAAGLVAGYDVVCDGTDNFPARAALAAACFRAGIVLVSAAVLRFEGQLAVFGPGTPCYRCLYPQAPPAGVVTSCAQAGVLGAVTGVMGTLQATEVLKLLLGVGETLAGRLLIWDALATRFRSVRLRRDPACPLCGGAGAEAFSGAAAAARRFQG
jgi:adenylyltransferase/sulfurtransferase